MSEYDNVRGLPGFTNVMMERKEISKIWEEGCTTTNWEGNENSCIWKCRERSTGKYYFFIGDNIETKYPTLGEAIIEFQKLHGKRILD